VRQIHVTPTDAGAFDVEVRDGAHSTSHTVTVPRGLPQVLGWPPDRDVELIRTSFEFLLEREPAESILRRFSLDVIGEYFPDYVAEMARRVDPTT
jgi:bifunctional DNA-binding transcriptional regulator/antitoxin component of YhaV-PrlF toxin-antitoxin module